jgi:hypothetical protein
LDNVYRSYSGSSDLSHKKRPNFGPFYRERWLHAFVKREGCCQLLSGGDMNELVRTKCHMERALNVLKHHKKGVHTVYEVLLPKSDPCPSPEIASTSTLGEAKVEVDIAQTMCDVWSRVSEVGLKYKKAARRQASKRDYI